MLDSVSIFVGNSVEEDLELLADIGLQLKFYPKVVRDSFSDKGTSFFFCNQMGSPGID